MVLDLVNPVLTLLTLELSQSLHLANLLQLQQSLSLLTCLLHLLQQPVQKLMRIFLDTRVDGLAIEIFVRVTKLFWN